MPYPASSPTVLCRQPAAIPAPLGLIPMLNLCSRSGLESSSLLLMKRMQQKWGGVTSKYRWQKEFCLYVCCTSLLLALVHFDWSQLTYGGTNIVRDRYLWLTASKDQGPANARWVSLEVLLPKCITEMKTALWECLSQRTPSDDFGSQLVIQLTGDAIMR